MTDNDLPGCCSDCPAPSLCEAGGCVGMSSSQELCSDDEIEKALALCEAATPGPWDSAQCGEGKVRIYPLGMEENGTLQCWGPDYGPGSANADAAFIASARTGWPAALLALREARSMLMQSAKTKAEYQTERDDAREDAARLREALTLARVYLRAGRFSDEEWIAHGCPSRDTVPTAVDTALSPQEPDKEKP